MDRITKISVEFEDGRTADWEGRGGVMVTNTVTPSRTGETKVALGATEISFVQAQLLIQEQQ